MTRRFVSPIGLLAVKKQLRVAGLMSGTSADGVDVAIVDIAGRAVDVLAFDTFGYTPALRRRLFELFDSGRTTTVDLARLNVAVGEAFASALIELAGRSGIDMRSVDLIGSHGQTVCHDPVGGRIGRCKARSTLQIGEPCVIAERTGITTVADFRPRDVAAGGQGAPLVPYADYVLLADRRLNRAIQNIGGIANVTFLPAGGGMGSVIAFDTGPGNMVIDQVVGRMSRGRRRYDADGRMAAAGKVDDKLLAELMAHPFLRRGPPKSAGREQFGAGFVERMCSRAQRRAMAGADVVATATAFTACSIADAYRRFLPVRIDQVILCGGGARNRTLVEMLRRRLDPVEVMLTDDFGISADAKEAVSFAILARETICGVPANVPSATGADGPVILGKIIPGKVAAARR
ncbi:MAG TPA: anhydro-N-acetylmuramic acid kinase [Phycisphaerae bacterium]|nr:anhydro-N-acetylmuramic acid kinase [Phycisphaerae bacterium]